LLSQGICSGVALEAVCGGWGDEHAAVQVGLSKFVMTNAVTQDSVQEVAVHFVALFELFRSRAVSAALSPKPQCMLAIGTYVQRSAFNLSS
jgi:hypothetical protein